MDLNRATILGRLTRDPEVRTTTSGKNVTSFAVATAFVWKDQAGQPKEAVEYHNVVAWRRLGEIVAQYMRKGSRVLVEGRLQTRSWEGQDGKKNYRTEIIADNVIMLDSRGAQGQGQASTPAATVPQEPVSTIQIDEEPQQPKAQAPQSEEISVEDIPF